jgi:trans-aconitate methyltransferase
MADWDAERYHRLSDPQLGWGRKVLERLDPRPGERILDVGCGTGRLTAEIAGRTGRVVVGLDRSAAMLDEARRSSAANAVYVRGDGARLPFAGQFDAVYSAATFHWIRDHDRLFDSIYAALRPGGRLVAQCGGGPNLRRLLNRTHALMDSASYAGYFNGWSDPWTFAFPEETRARLERVGFSRITTSLEEAPTVLPGADAFTDFISCVCVRHHVDVLPPDLRVPFVAGLAKMASMDTPPYSLDYWRLNITAWKDNA